MTRRDDRCKNPRPRSGPGDAARTTRTGGKDTTMLRTFISGRETTRARRITGLTSRQQRDMAGAVTSAREMTLLPCSSRTGQ